MTPAGINHLVINVRDMEESHKFWTEVLGFKQVGQSSRVIVLDVAREGEKPQPLRLANPEILWRSPELMTFSEGCLSLPEHYGDVSRPAAIRLRSTSLLEWLPPPAIRAVPLDGLCQGLVERTLQRFLL